MPESEFHKVLGTYLETVAPRSVKVFSLAAIVLLFFGCTRSADYGTSGALSDRLHLTVSYEPAKPQFTLVLQNRSCSALRVLVESQQFHGRIFVAPAAGKPFELVDSRYLPLLTTGIANAPMQTLYSQTTITWRLPASGLTSLDGIPFHPKTLAGAQLYAKLDEVAIVPPSAETVFKTTMCVSNNARQVSAVITIPDRAEP